MSWINDLDACATAGIVSFDAPAYIKDAQPRYVGNPDFAYLPDELVPMKNQPKKDEFKSNDTHRNPLWKKILFGTMAAAMVGGLIFAISKGKLKFKNMNIMANIKNSKIVQFIKNIPQKIKNMFKSSNP